LQKNPGTYVPGSPLEFPKFTPLGRPCLTAGEAEVLAVLKQAGFVAEVFAEILHEIQPRFGIAFQTLKDRSTLDWYSPGLVFANLAAGPVKKFQVLVQSHRQAALVAGSTNRRLFANLGSRWLQGNRSEAASLLTCSIRMS